MYLASDDSAKLFTNKFYDFTVETNREYLFGNCREWSFALTELFLEDTTEPNEPLKVTLVKTPFIVHCDLAVDSYIRNCSRQVLRLVPKTSSEGSSLLQPQYISVSKSRTNRIRIYLTDIDLEEFDPLITDPKNKLILRCTLHFINNKHV